MSSELRADAVRIIFDPFLLGEFLKRFYYTSSVLVDDRRFGDCWGMKASTKARILLTRRCVLRPDRDSRMLQCDPSRKSMRI